MVVGIGIGIRIGVRVRSREELWVHVVRPLWKQGPPSSTTIPICWGTTFTTLPRFNTLYTVCLFHAFALSLFFLYSLSMELCPSTEFLSVSWKTSISHFNEFIRDVYSGQKYRRLYNFQRQQCRVKLGEKLWIFSKSQIKLLYHVRKCKILNVGASHDSKITHTIVQVQHLNDYTLSNIQLSLKKHLTGV